MPLVHVVFNGDLTTEQPDLAGHIGVALVLIGCLCWLWLWRGPDPFSLRLPRKA